MEQQVCISVNAVSMQEITPRKPPERIAFGNIDPVGLFKFGNNRETGKRGVNELLDDVSYYKNFVLSSGCDVLFGVPLRM